MRGLRQIERARLGFRLKQTNHLRPNARAMKRPDNHQYTGIEALLRARKLVTDDRFYSIDQASLVKWAREDSLQIWQAVALHSFIDPDGFGIDATDALDYLLKAEASLRYRLESEPGKEPTDQLKLRFFDNLAHALDGVRRGALRCHSWSGIELASRSYVAEFHAWAIRVELPVILGWRDRSAERVDRWAWGRHNTPLLEALEAAAKAHWRRLDEGGQYDPADPSSASPNPKVAAWIQERFPVASKETAEVMARILRDPSLPAGRPREQ